MLQDESYWAAARLPSVEELHARLALVFPPGLDGRSLAVAERAAKSLYVFLYVLAVDGVSPNRVRPAMVTTMSDAQARLTAVPDRIAWWNEARKPRKPGVPIVGRWYAENTREPIRDETFRIWKDYGALIEDQVATTASTPRYRLARDFADLFDPSLEDAALEQAMSAWQEQHLTPAARARTVLVKRQAIAAAGSTIRFPDGTSRHLALGPSTALVHAVIEEFTPRFLRQPVILAVTESRQRLAFEDQAQLEAINLIPDARLMPDVMLADLEWTKPSGMRLIFAECVATAGEMNAGRVSAIRAWLGRNGLDSLPVAFGTVFADRGDPAFRRWGGSVAWGTFIWFASEPDNLLAMYESGRYEARATLDQLTG